MTAWQWLDKAIILAVHDRQIAEHGGGQGIRDEGLLESALNRPVNLASYGDPAAADLAAAYAFGIARNHPFIDGNKRTAWVAARLFLMVNAVEITFDKADATVMMQQLAAGDLSEDEVARWFRDHIVARG